MKTLRHILVSALAVMAILLPARSHAQLPEHVEWSARIDSTAPDRET